MTIVVTLMVLGGLTFVLAVMLVIANKKLHVYEDPRIDLVEDMLPHANCGACGLPGCRPFAEALVAGEIPPAKCTVCSVDDHVNIADYLGIDIGEAEKKIARLACAGGANVARNKANYEGMNSCVAASMISGGGKGCFWGCLGFGDCKTVCDFDAITMNQFDIPVVDPAKCTACGDCVEICPKDLFSLQPIDRHLWVACKSLERGDAVIEDCQVGCNACGKCAMDAPGTLIKMIENLPVIDYRQNHQTQIPIERCPTGAIVWIDDNEIPHKGKESKKVIRKMERLTGNT